MSTQTHDMNWGGLSWSEWVPLFSEVSVFQRHIAKFPGLYRVRSRQAPGLVYVGQTGRNLRERTRSLAIHSTRGHDSPPWNDPHTAAPILWAYHHEDQFEYEVSVACTEDFDYATRQCYEDYLLHLHRMEHGHSTLANHGRFHPLWTRPSNKSAKRSMKRLETPTPYDSIEKINAVGEFGSALWLGLKWSKSQPISRAKPPACPGIYQICGSDVMLYCGETQQLSDRINTHKKNPNFIDSSISYHLMPNARSHHLKEREVDMIGAYFESSGAGPKYQYKNNR